MAFLISKIWNLFSQKTQARDGYKEFQVTCDASIDENHLAYISLTKGKDRKGIVKYALEAEEARIMVDIGHDGEVVGIEILGEKRVPSILKEHLHS